MEQDYCASLPSENSTRASSGSKSPHGPPDRAVSPLAHTLTACSRCRQRKTRCDPRLPRCTPCERNNVSCEYWDPEKGRTMSRFYVTTLQDKVQALEAELATLESQDAGDPDPEISIRSAGLVRYSESDEPQYLGPSSGIAMTRLVMDFAKQSTTTKTIKEVVSDEKAQRIKERFLMESTKPTSKVYPLISSVAAASLPSRDLTDRLIENFNRRAQYMYPTLHEPSFLRVVENVYAGSGRPYDNFTVRIVIAISMQKLDTQYAGLADSYYLSALQHLEGAMESMDLETLQCFALIAQYSLLTPTRTACHWIIGIAVRLCQALGITDEATIGQIPQYNALEIDMRRRLYWIILTMEYGLAHSLGRPSAFGTTHVNVGFFEPVDDQFLTTDGVMPGSPQSIKKLITIHYCKMRLLQSEIRRKLYLVKRPEPKSDQDPWFISMEVKLEEWLHATLIDDEGSGLSKTWFEGRYNTMIVFLHRPSPQIPNPSIRSVFKCYEACEFNVNMQREQIRSRSIDLTWAFTQSLYMAISTILWTLSYPEIRQAHPRNEVEDCLKIAVEAMCLAAERWPGVESALELYHSLIAACLKAYEEVSPLNSPFVANSTLESVTAIKAAAPLKRDRMAVSSVLDSFEDQSSAAPPYKTSLPTIVQNRPFGSSKLPDIDQSKYSQISQQNTRSSFTTGKLPTFQAPPEPSHHSKQLGFSDLQSSASSLLIPPNTAREGISRQRGVQEALVPSFKNTPQSLPRFHSWNGNLTSPISTLQAVNQMGEQYPGAYLHAVSQQPWPLLGDPQLHGNGLNQTQQAELMQFLEADVSHGTGSFMPMLTARPG